MNEKILSMDKISIRQNHPWMEKSHPCTKVSSMDNLMDDILHVDVIHGDENFYPTPMKDYGKFQTYFEQLRR